MEIELVTELRTRWTLGGLLTAWVAFQGASQLKAVPRWVALIKCHVHRWHISRSGRGKEIRVRWRQTWIRSQSGQPLATVYVLISFGIWANLSAFVNAFLMQSVNLPIEIATDLCAAGGTHHLSLATPLRVCVCFSIRRIQIPWSLWFVALAAGGGCGFA